MWFQEFEVYKFLLTGLGSIFISWWIFVSIFSFMQELMDGTTLFIIIEIEEKVIAAARNSRWYMAVTIAKVMRLFIIRVGFPYKNFYWYVLTVHTVLGILYVFNEVVMGPLIPLHTSHLRTR